MDPACYGLLIFIVIGWFFFREGNLNTGGGSKRGGGGSTGGGGPSGSFGQQQDEDLYDYFGYGREDEGDEDYDDEDGWEYGDEWEK